MITAFDANGDAGHPLEPLPPGVVFFRLFGLQGSAVVTGASPTWEINVRHHSASVDSAWGSFLDVNGDGYADVLISEYWTSTPFQMNPPPSRVNAYLGSANGWVDDTSISAVDPAADETEKWVAIASLGDIDGDGFGDVAIGTSVGADTPSPASTVRVYRGGPDGLAKTPMAIIDVAPSPYIAGAGDANGDGYADVTINGSLYSGGPAGLTLAPFGAGVNGYTPIGDVDGDGLADFAKASAGAAPKLEVVLGAKADLAPNGPTATFPVASGKSYLALSPAGDIDGDGYADIVALETSYENKDTQVAVSVLLFHGGSTGPADGIVAFDAGTDPTGTFTYAIAGVGDVDGDGFDDVVLARGSPINVQGIGAATLLRGGSTGLTASAASISEPVPGAFGQMIVPVGDMNGDGLADTMIAEHASVGGSGQFGYYFFTFEGTPGGLPSEPVVPGPWVNQGDSGQPGFAITAAFLGLLPRKRFGASRASGRDGALGR